MYDLKSHRKFIVFLTFFGLYQTQVIQNFKINLKIFFFLNLFVFLATVTYTIWNLNRIVSLLNSVSIFSDILQLLAFNCTTISIYIVSVRKRHEYIKVYENLQKFDNLFGNNYFDRVPHGYYYDFAFLWIVTALVEIGSFCSILGVECQWTQFWTVTIYMSTMSRLWILNHLMYIHFMLVRLDVLNFYFHCALIRITHMSRREIRIEVKRLVLAYRYLWTVMWNVNKIFGFTQMLNFVLNFANLIVQFYWVYLHIIYHIGDATAVLYCWVPCFLHIAVLIHQSNHLIKRRSITISQLIQLSERHVHQIPRLVRFMYTLLQEPIYVDGGRFFIIDYRIVNPLLHMFTTYLVIWIQTIPEEYKNRDYFNSTCQ